LSCLLELLDLCPPKTQKLPFKIHKIPINPENKSFHAPKSPLNTVFPVQ
jgi:hypothetical protein